MTKSKIIREEYMMSMGEMKEKFPMGSLQSIKGNLARVVGYIDSLPTTSFLSLPQVEFSVVEPVAWKALNRRNWRYEYLGDEPSEEYKEALYTEVIPLYDESSIMGEE